MLCFQNILSNNVQQPQNNVKSNETITSTSCLESNHQTFKVLPVETNIKTQ